MNGLAQQLQSLLEPRSYPHPVDHVELIETHVSWVLLTGEFAYKIKRPVCYSFVDLRCAERRRVLCEEEVRLNRRFAPQLYLGVCPINLVEGNARLQGTGPVIEYAIKLRQFRGADELAVLLQEGGISPAELENFGCAMARLHEDLPVARSTQAWGRPGAIRDLILQNFAQCQRAATIFDSGAAVQTLRSTLQARLDAAVPVMTERFFGGRVRECHADLHAGNVVRWQSRLLPFDCLEFDPALRWIDVADEIAFLIADLEAMHFRAHAHAFLTGYLAESGDYGCCRLLPLYKLHRCLVRAKVMALSADGAGCSDPAADERGMRRAVRQNHRRFQQYLREAQNATRGRQPHLMLMSGLSGSGKSWVARGLAAALEGVQIRSDVERMRLAGPSARSLPECARERGLYSEDVTTRVYEHLARCAGQSLAGGYTTIVDATFNLREHRARFHHLAEQLGVESCIVHCHATQEVLETRIHERARLRNDASQADLSVLRWQRTHREPITAAEQLPVLEADTTDPHLLDRLLEQIARHS